MEKIRLGLAGAWHVHTAHFMKSIRDMLGDRVSWLWVWDDNEERALRFSRELGARRALTLDDLISDPEVDAVPCEAETCKHKDVILRSARAGKPVYTDKVLTVCTKDALEIREALEQSGVKFAVSHEAIPVSAYQYAKKLLDTGALGKPVSMHFRRAHGGARPGWLTAEGRPINLPGDWFSKEIAGGGALIDLGIHGVSLLTYFCGRPKTISAFTHSFNGQETEDSATILVEFENGAIGTAHTDMTTSIMDNSFELLGTEGQLTVVGMEGQEELRLHSEHLSAYKGAMTRVDRGVYAASPSLNPVCQFVRFVMDEEDRRQYLDGLDIETGIRVVRMVEAAYESAAAGSAVAY